MPTKYNDYPLNDLAVTVGRVNANGGDAYLKFTCHWCGSRQTIDTPNTLFAEGRCDECNSVTDITKTGGNLLVVYRKPKMSESV